MPWNPEDSLKHHKGLNKKQQEKWAAIANAILSKDGDEGKAIRIANSKVYENMSEDQLNLQVLNNEDDVQMGDRVKTKSGVEGNVSTIDGNNVTIRKVGGGDEKIVKSDIAIFFRKLEDTVDSVINGSLNLEDISK